MSSAYASTDIPISDVDPRQLVLQHAQEGMYAEGVQGHTRRTSLSFCTLNRNRPGQVAIYLYGCGGVFVHGVNAVNKPCAYSISNQDLK